MQYIHLAQEKVFTKIMIKQDILNKLFKTIGTDDKFVKANIANCVYLNKPLDLIIFTCSTINPKFLFDQDNPEKYVSLNPVGNNLEADLSMLKDLYKKISKIYPAKITILIGNTDPYYIYSQSWKIYKDLPSDILWKQFSKRWDSYKQNLKLWLNSELLNANLEVISWFELEKTWEKNTGNNFEFIFNKTYKNILSYFPKNLLNWEVEKLRTQFGPDKYFYNIKAPKLSTLNDWTKRKFAEYAVQGFWIKQIFPYSILLQNEKPSLLRTKMYQPLIKKYLKSELPVIYPFGVDNSGFQ